VSAVSELDLLMNLLLKPFDKGYIRACENVPKKSPKILIYLAIQKEIKAIFFYD